MSIIQSQPLIGASGNQGVAGYNLTKSLRFRSSASAYLNRTPASASNRQTWTWSAWVKRGKLTTGVVQYLFEGRSGTNQTSVYFTDQDALQFEYYDGSANYYQVSTPVYRDPSAWYHIVAIFDTTNATSSNRMRMYVNGVQITSFIAAGYPTQNLNGFVNNTNSHAIGARADNLRWFDGYMAEINFIDGQALTPSSFGENNTTTGVWQPKKYTGTYGTNGFYLPFTNTTSTSTLGNDSSGNGNNWTTNNFSLTTGSTYDSMTDVPTLTSATAANYAVLNPLDNGGLTIQDGNLQAYTATSSWRADRASFGVSSGKWYWEVSVAMAGLVDIGIQKSTATLTDYIGSDSSGWGYYSANGQKFNSPTFTSYGATYGNGDVIGVALDLDAGTLTFYKNNSSQGTAFTGLSGTFFPAVSSNATGGSGSLNVNFGQRPFAYTPPTGYVALNTYNLPTSTIVAGNKYMDATTYTGDGSTSRSITNAASFKPDLVWIKERDISLSHLLYNSVVGAGALKALSSNTTASEASGDNNSTYGYLNSFDTNGFSVERGSNGTVSYTNKNTGTYVAWQWQAGQGTTSSNTAGSITSTVSVNASAGFSIVTYTGTGSNATVGHGLGDTPKIIIVKCRNTAGESWQVYHIGLTSAAYRIRLNAADAEDSQPTMWNSTNPTSSVFSIGTASGTNANTQTYVAYCWTNINGFSSIGKYIGNGSTDGTFVYTGFRPKYILIKRTDVATYQWATWDTVRNTYNAANSNLWSDSSEAETTSTGYDIDIISNGFKLRTTNVARNANGGSYIYMAFAENPLKNSLAR